MTRRRKFILQCSNQSHPSQQKTISRKQRRCTQKCLRRRRRERRIKMQSRSSSATTQIGTNVQSLEFIQRSELTRQHALTMPHDQQLIVFFREYNKNRIFPSVKHELDDEDYYSSYV